MVTPDFKVHCSGGATFYGRYFKCHLKGGHGIVDMRHAIEKSCNVYFYTLGNMLGVDRMHKWATRLGLGVKSGIDLPNEIEGIMPSTAWKRKRNNEKWYAGETISVAIGQGQVSVTPISLAVMMATVANGGTRFAPRLVKALRRRAGVEAIWSRRRRSRRSGSSRPPTARCTTGCGWSSTPPAPAGAAAFPGCDVSGKTGTAQVISLTGRKAARNSEKDLRDHGWFVFFAPRDNPEIAGVIFAEHAEHGYSAAPIARHMIATYFAKKRGEPLPAFTAPGLPPPTPPQEEVPIEPDAPRAGGRCVADADRRRPVGPDMFERRLYFHLDWLLLAAILRLSLMGIAMIYSATQATTPRLYQQQVYALLLGLRRARPSRCRSTTARWPTSPTGSTSASSCC